jgi:hypothetical protein
MGTGFFIHHRIISTVRAVDFISERMSYKVLRGRWFNSIVLNVHAPIEEKSEDSKGSVYEILKQVFNRFPKYHIKTLVRDFNAKVGRGDIFKLAIGMRGYGYISIVMITVCQYSNDSGVRRQHHFKKSTC